MKPWRIGCQSVVLALCVGLTSHAALLIDNFNTTQYLPGTNTGSASYVLGPGILGGERDAQAYAPTVDINGAIPNHLLAYNAQTPNSGTIFLDYDGLNYSTSTFDTDGLGDVDLTEGGQDDRVRLNFSAAIYGGGTLTVTVQNSGFASSSITVPMPSSAGPLDLPFASFQTSGSRPVNFAAAGWIRLQIVLNPGESYTLSSILTVPGPSAAGAITQWVWRNPQPFCPQLNSVTHGGGLWLVFGNVGVLATSPDGIAWDLASFGTNSVSTIAACGNGRCVAASSRGNFFSTNGHNWSAAATPGSLSDLCFGNGLFVGVSSGSGISRSADGSGWTGESLDYLAQLNSISYANGRFFALGVESSTPSLFSSTDATNWTGPISLGTNAVQRVIFGNGVYVGLNPLVNSSGVKSEFRTSADGTVWSVPLVLTNTYVTDGLFANGQFVAVDEGGGVLFSGDGVNWQRQPAASLFGCTKIDWDGNLYVATGPGGRIVSSQDATNWTRRTTGPQNSLVGIIHTNGLYIAVGGNLYDPYSQSTVIVSTNGHDWIEHAPNTSNSLTSAAFGTGRYVAVGANGAIVTSTDTTSWTPTVSPTTNLLYSIACGGGRFVAVGGTTTRATILNSADGLSWSTQTNATNFSTLYAVTYAQGLFVAVGQTNSSGAATVLTSPDGLAWTARAAMASNNLRAVCFGNAAYVATGDRGTIATSSDAVTWANVSSSAVISWRGIAYGHGYYVAIGSVPFLLYSPDAINWTLYNRFTTLTEQPLYGIVSGDNSFFIVGYQGEAFESGPFTPPAPQATLGLRQAGQTYLSFTGPEYHGYEIQCSDTMPPAWQPLLTLTNLSATTTVPLNPVTNLSARFYRSRLIN